MVFDFAMFFLDAVAQTQKVIIPTFRALFKPVISRVSQPHKFYICLKFVS